MQMTDGEIRDVVGLVDQIFAVMNRKVGLVFDDTATARLLAEIDEEINILRARMMLIVDKK